MGPGDMPGPDGFPSTYRLICPELNQYQMPLDDCWTSQLFQRKDETWFYETFVKPVPDAGRVQNFHPPGGDLFERLPNEIIDEIFEYVLLHEHIRIGELRHSAYLAHRKAEEHVREDFLALGLSSARLWPLVLGRLHRGYQKNHWAGRKVGFHSKHSKLTAEQMRNYGIEDTTFMSGERQIFRLQDSIRVWKWDHFSIYPDSEWRSLLHPWHGHSSERAFKMSKYEMETRPEDRDKIERDLSRIDLRITEREWVLRNLTTRQYVRSDQLQEPACPAPDWGPPPKSQEPLLPKMRRLCKTLTQQMRNSSEDNKHSGPKKHEALTLANIFLVLTCSAPNTLPHFERTDSPKRYLNFEDGPWAGCAFDVIPLDDHLQSQQRQSESKAQPDESWVNMSQEVVADVANLRFCVRRQQEMKTYGHSYYPLTCNHTAYWEDYWAKVTRTRKLHRQWVKTCPPRPWIDESMYAST